MDEGGVWLIVLFAAVIYCLEWPQKLWSGYRQRRRRQRQERQQREQEARWREEEIARHQQERHEQRTRALAAQRELEAVRRAIDGD